MRRRCTAKRGGPHQGPASPLLSRGKKTHLEKENRDMKPTRGRLHAMLAPAKGTHRGSSSRKGSAPPGIDRSIYLISLSKAATPEARPRAASSSKVSRHSPKAPWDALVQQAKGTERSGLLQATVRSKHGKRRPESHGRCEPFSAGKPAVSQWAASGLRHSEVFPHPRPAPLLGWGLDWPSSSATAA